MCEVLDVLGGKGAAKGLEATVDKCIRSDGLVNYHKFIALYTARIPLKLGL